MTFDLLLGFDQKLTTLAAQFVAFTETLKTHAGYDKDHEARLRLLESQLTALATSSSTSSGNWKEVWYVALAALTLLATLGNLAAFILHK